MGKGVKDFIVFEMKCLQYSISSCYSRSMKFRHLHENLRKLMVERVAKGEFTGSKLAEQVDFRQAHICNFLNGKRSLSMYGCDRVLTVKRLSVLDLLDPKEINKRATILPASRDEFENVPLVEGGVAASDEQISSANVKDILKFKKSFLKRLRPAMETRRDDWRRFVVIKVDGHEGMSMFPRLLPGATLLIDRHYNSLAPYRKGEAQNMYAVRQGAECTVKYVELSDNTLVLRPHNQSYPVSVIALEGRRAGEAIVGRVCLVEIET